MKEEPEESDDGDEENEDANEGSEEVKKGYATNGMTRAQRMAARHGEPLKQEPSPAKGKAPPTVKKEEKSPSVK